MARRDDEDAGSWETEEIRLPHDGPDAPPPVRAGAAMTPGDLPAGPDEAPDGPDDPIGMTRRQRRQTITFLASFALIVLLGVAALASYFGTIDLGIGTGKPAALPTCPPPAATPSLQAHADTTVRVYNASTRNGLALSVMRELQKRGFQVPDGPANDPQKTPMKTMAVIRHGPNGELAAATVATVVAGKVTLVADERAGSDVDLVLGQTFELAQPAASSAATPSPTAEATCVPVDG